MKEVLGLGSDSSRSTLWLYTHGVKLGIVMGRLKEPSRAFNFIARY